MLSFNDDLGGVYELCMLGELGPIPLLAWWALLATCLAFWRENVILILRSFLPCVFVTKKVGKDD